MNYQIELNNVKNIKFCDYIEVTDENDDIYVFNIYYSRELGFCLSTEDEPLIKFLRLKDYYLYANYIDNTIKKYPNRIKTITIDTHWLEKKNECFNLQALLFFYDSLMAGYYKLYDHKTNTTAIKKVAIAQKKKLKRKQPTPTPTQN